MISVFPATLRHAKGLAVCFMFVVGLAMIVPLFYRAYWIAALIVALTGLVVWRFKRMYLRFSDETLIHRGWWTTDEMPYASITQVFRPYTKGWPQDRFYGPSVFQIASANNHIRINLLWLVQRALEHSKIVSSVPLLISTRLQPGANES